MLIRSTADACFVMLRNGLTLEIVYDPTHAGTREAVEDQSLFDDTDLPPASSGVWLIGETVLLEVQAGQA